MKTKAINHNLDEIMPVLMGAWRRLHKEAGPLDKLQTREFHRVCKAVEDLQNKKVPDNYFSDREFLGAYMLYQFVVHYQQGLSILGEIPTPFSRVLDICSGPGAFSLAALQHGASEVIATDQNALALQMASEICGRSGHTLKIREWDCKKANPFINEDPFDLIILGHSLQELFPAEASQIDKQQAFIEKLLKMLSPQGFLVIVDSSDLATNQMILKLRDKLVEKQIPIQAPCIWKGACPALQTKNSPCYAQREFFKPYIVKEIQRVLDIKLSSLKMSYLILRNPAFGPLKLDDKPYYRVISPPVESFHGKRYYLCGTAGKKNIGSRLEVIPKEAKAFEYIKRGELITFANVSENGSQIDLVEGSSLKVAAACGKPVPELDES